MNDLKMMNTSSSGVTLLAEIAGFNAGKPNKGAVAFYGP